MQVAPPSPETRFASERKFVIVLAAAAVLIAALPTLLAMLASPAGGAYLGYQYATDDHMVYAAWTRQAMDGRFLFDNRFTTDAQPGLTVHLYFLALGFVAKVTGIAMASNLARLGFSFLFVWLLYRLLQKLEWEISATKLAAALSVIGGGIGFLVWHLFGEAIVKPSPLSGVMLGRLPTDVWQPEGFVLSSMLTNGLFMVSLCLIVVVFRCYLEARESNRAVMPGALALGLLMNIHSYDVLLIALVMVTFVAATVVEKQLTKAWLIRAGLITLGVVPAALWFVYVLRNDPVFQARAATETYSANFRQVLFGYLPLMLIGLAGMLVPTEERCPKRSAAGVGLFALVMGGLFVGAATHTEGYFLSLPAFGAVFLACAAASVLLSSKSPAWNLIVAWAFVGTIAIYFPGLFQRKLAMGLSIPWAILAAGGLYAVLRTQERSARNLVMALAIVLLGGSGLRWVTREFEFVSANCSRTSVHPVFLSPNENKIIEALNGEPGRKVLIAPPGVPSPLFGKGEQETGPRKDLTPTLPDLNTIASGLTGVYTYAGHWSETPDYNRRRGQVASLFFGNATRDERAAALQKMGVTHVIAPAPEAFPGQPVFDFRELGQVVVDGEPFRLIRLIPL